MTLGDVAAELAALGCTAGIQVKRFGSRVWYADITWPNGTPHGGVSHGHGKTIEDAIRVAIAGLPAAPAPTAHDGPADESGER